MIAARARAFAAMTDDTTLNRDDATRVEGLMRGPQFHVDHVFTKRRPDPCSVWSPASRCCAGATRPGSPPTSSSGWARRRGVTATPADADMATATPGGVGVDKLSSRATNEHRWFGRRSSAVNDLPSTSGEQALVARAKAGDRVAYEALVRHNADRLYAVVLRFSATESDAEEATQEAFLRAWRSIGRFRGDARFFTWLYRIGVNEAKRILDRRPRAGPGSAWPR